MMTYVLVGLGGAIGSMLRYWLGLLSVAAWGGGFPWGTILINITGSFLIGLVGAATMAEGVLPAGPAVRLFVMVGLCGGYTTFSSFSLQTLDLVRDGRLAAGLLNVALSVVLCLAAVAAGHYAATALGSRGLFEAEASRPRGHVVLAVLERPEQVRGQIAAAAWAAGIYGGSGGNGRVEALAIRTAPHESDMSTEEVSDTGQAEAMRHGEGERADQLRGMVESWAASAGARPVGWSEPQGDAGTVLRRAGSGVDLLVVGQPEEGGGTGEVLHAALFRARRPVLMLPRSQDCGGTGAVVAVAWRDDLAARRSVQAAMPLLRCAGRVVLLNDPGLRSVPAVFGRRGVTVEMRSVQGGYAEPGERLLHAARLAQADLLVMGAFIHSPLRERVLGGITRHVIATATLPVFMRH